MQTELQNQLQTRLQTYTISERVIIEPETTFTDSEKGSTILPSSSSSSQTFRGLPLILRQTLISTLEVEMIIETTIQSETSLDSRGPYYRPYIEGID